MIEQEHKVRGRLQQVAQHIVEEKKYSTIARALGLEEPTVRTYYQRLCGLLGVPHS
jgi:DNA-binding NarL/FixJ family response regulator